MLNKPFFGIAPKPLEAVDVNPSLRKMGLVINGKMTIATKHKSVVSPVTVGIYDASTPDFPDRKVQQGFRFDIRNDLNSDYAVTLQNAKNRDFAGCASSTFTLSMTAEIGFVHLDLAAEKGVSIFSMGENGHPYGIYGLIGGVVTHGKLRGHFACRYFQFKELYDPKPLAVRKIPVVYPSPASVLKCIFASRTSVFFIGQSIQLSTPATRAKPLLVFEAKSQHVFL